MLSECSKPVQGPHGVDVRPDVRPAPQIDVLGSPFVKASTVRQFVTTPAGWLAVATVLVAGGAGVVLLINAGSSPNTPQHAAHTTSKPISALDAEVAHCSGAVAGAVDTGYLEFGDAYAFSDDVMRYHGANSPTFHAFYDVAGEFMMEALHGGYRNVADQLPRMASEACRSRLSAQHHTGQPTSSSETASILPRSSKSSEAVPTLTPSDIDQCSQQIVSVLRSVVDGTLSLEAGKRQLPEVVPPAGLESAVEGVTRYMEDGLSREDAIHEASSGMVFFCRTPQ